MKMVSRLGIRKIIENNMKVPEKYRVKDGMMGSDESYGNNGMFLIPFESYELKTIASDGEGWEHVSVSMNHRTPNWKEMSFVKDLFWEEDEAVVQYHPPKKLHINNHDHCLHLWKPQNKEVDLPPAYLVGV